MSTRTVVVPLPAVQWGGLQAFAENIAGDLEKTGWRWLVVVPEEATGVCERLRQSGVETIAAPLPRFRRSPLQTAQSLLQLAPAMNALMQDSRVAASTIVQAVGAHHLHGMLLAGRRKPLVWQIHSSILPPLARRVVAPLISRRAHAIMTNGRAVAKAFWGSSDLGSRHFVFYAPVDEDKFAPDAATRSAARAELGIPADAIAVGTIGNRVWQKNHALLVACAREFAPLYPRLRFVVLGAEHAAYRDEYERTVAAPAAQLNQQYPHYFNIVDPGRRVPFLLQAFDLFALTSHAEGVPIALFEAMAAGKPVLSTRVGSIAEIVEEGETGHLVEPGDAPGYVQALRSTLSDIGRLESFGQRGRNRILTMFSKESVVQAHVNAYEYASEAFAKRKR